MDIDESDDESSGETYLETAKRFDDAKHTEHAELLKLADDKWYDLEG